jgi:hypothetical protein
MKNTLFIAFISLFIAGCNLSSSFTDEAVFNATNPLEMPVVYGKDHYGTNKTSRVILEHYLAKKNDTLTEKLMLSYQFKHYTLILDFEAKQYIFKADESSHNADFKFKTSGSLDVIGSVVQLDLSSNQFLKHYYTDMADGNVLNLLLFDDTSAAELDSNVFNLWPLNKYRNSDIYTPVIFNFQEIINP